MIREGAWAAMFALTALFLFPRLLPAQCDLPVVGTAVVIDADRLLRKFDLQARNQAARDAARELARLGGDLFPLFCWVPAGSSAAQEPVAKLIAHVTNGRGGRNGAVVVRYHFEARGKSEELCGVGEGKVPEAVLYPNKHPGPDAQSRQLFKDIVARFQNLSEDGIPRTLEKRVASKIHLSRKVEIRKERQRILIPFDEVRMKAGRGTKLWIDFTEDPDEGDRLVYVTKDGPCRKRKRKLFSTQVTGVNVPERPELTGWNDEVLGLLKDAMDKNLLAVFLEFLIPDSCTEVHPGITVPPEATAVTSCPGCVSPP